MHGFPALDGIPLPAPVWLFKLLHIAILGLHFTLVQYLLGSLLIAGVWEWRGRNGGNEVMRTGARQLSRWMPTTMTFLINLGVPPLLFAQVLYGTALYTSSTLVGAYWISVIGWLLLMYGFIYWGQFRATERRPWWLMAAGAVGIGCVIAAIYSCNMTLMLRPDVWAQMYRANATGTLPFADITVWPRTAFMLAGGLLVGGLGLLMAGAPAVRSSALRALMLRDGGLLTVVGAAAQLAFGLMVLSHLQPGVREAMSAHLLTHLAMLLWAVLWAAAVALGVWALKQRPEAVVDGVSLPKLQIAAVAVAVLLSIIMATVRDGIRDLTLRLAGFDVWSLPVQTNGGVLAIFLVLVVVALALVGLLVAITLRAAPAEEV